MCSGRHKEAKPVLAPDPENGISAGVSDRGLYKGYAVTGIDGKGRVGIPASLRTTLEKNAPGRFVTIAREPGEKFLTGYDVNWDVLKRQLIAGDEAAERSANRSFDRRTALRGALGPSEDTAFDESGRFILPKMMKEKAELTTTAFFYGVGDTFEIWSPKVLLSDPNADEMMVDICKWCLADKKITL